MTSYPIHHLYMISVALYLLLTFLSCYMEATQVVAQVMVT